MSLTRQLGRRGAPLREFFEARLPNLGGVQARWRGCGPAQIRPVPGVHAGTIGTAFDYRLRYLFDASTPPAQFVAHDGAGLLAGSKIDADDPAADAYMAFALGNDLYGRISEHLTALVGRCAPVGRRLAPAEEAELCRLCYVLALYEQCLRMGLRWESPLEHLATTASVPDALALVPDGAVADLAALVDGLHASELATWVGRPVVANPVFSGSHLVGGADGDLVVDACLIEIKVSALRPARDWVYQLLGYVLLDLHNALGIERVSFYHARGPALLTWPLQELLDEAGGRPVDMDGLRSEFRAVLGLQGLDQAS